MCNTIIQYKLQCRQYLYLASTKCVKLIFAVEATFRPKCSEVHLLISRTRNVFTRRRDCDPCVCMAMVVCCTIAKVLLVLSTTEASQDLVWKSSFTKMLTCFYLHTIWMVCLLIESGFESLLWPIPQVMKEPVGPQLSSGCKLACSLWCGVRFFTRLVATPPTHSEW